MRSAAAAVGGWLAAFFVFWSFARRPRKCVRRRIYRPHLIKQSCVACGAAAVPS